MKKLGTKRGESSAWGKNLGASPRRGSHYGVSLPGLVFPQKISKTFLNFLTGAFFFSRVQILDIFYVCKFGIHFCDFQKNFTGKKWFSRAVLKAFSGFFTEVIFFTSKNREIFDAFKIAFHAQKKKHWFYSTETDFPRFSEWVSSDWKKYRKSVLGRSAVKFGNMNILMKMKFRYSTSPISPTLQYLKATIIARKNFLNNSSLN